jgi:hypothetical protein
LICLSSANLFLLANETISCPPGLRQRYT